MPNVTVYIRNEDYEDWKAVKKKAALISWALGQIKQRRESKEPKYVAPEKTA